jgi:3-hydroxyisobutyrate dehydrogenase-like beta-hydroxyacid dehydrogenase
MTTKEFAKPNIGFIGMGHMGSHIALRLLASGYSLTVYNRTMDKTQQAASYGAHVAATPRAVAEQSDVIMSSVTDDLALQAVMFGPEGVLAGV